MCVMICVTCIIILCFAGCVLFWGRTYGGICITCGGNGIVYCGASITCCGPSIHTLILIIQ